MTEPDLSFLARQNERLISDVSSLRDDMRVLTAIVMRLDNTRERHEALLTDMVREIQAMNARAARTDDRLRSSNRPINELVG
jgi:hypothetical protein